VTGIENGFPMSFDLIILLVIWFIGLALVMARSSWAVDYTVFVFVFNRGLRRFIDYEINHEFNPLSPISLSSLAVAASMLLPVLVCFHELQPTARKILGFFSLAVIYAFAVGFINFKFAAFYALAEFVAPLSLFGYVILLKPFSAVKDRWFCSFAWCALLASVYGWYQYWTIPPWDGYWLMAAGMEGYMGIAKPTQMTVFSTMAERGVFGGFLGLSVVPMVLSKRWRGMPGPLGWAGVVLIFSVILLTFSRAGLMLAALGTITYALINRGRGSGQLIVAVGILGMAAWVGIDKIPSAGLVTKRIETFGNLDEDRSVQGRLVIMSGGVERLLANPLGLGLGGKGLATRVNSGGMGLAEGVVMDAGWLNILLIYGIPGSVFLLAALSSAWRFLAKRYRDRSSRDEFVMLARAMMITMVPACFVGDILTCFTIFWLALGCGISHSRPRARAQRRSLRAWPRPKLRNKAKVPVTVQGTVDEIEQGEEPQPDQEEEQDSRGFWLRG
jgi:uncharacterized membrane protein YhaH (DUF805 family)